jgi:NagD protein
MNILNDKKGIICDMDGVLYHGGKLLEGVKDFVDWLYNENKNFVFLTNSSWNTPKEFQQKLNRMGIDVDEKHFYTAALATASFIKSQNEHASAYVIGEHGLLNALYDAGVTISDVEPDYVIVGESESYGYENIIKAVKHVNNGAKLIGTCSDLTAPYEGGILPACRSLIAPIEYATRKSAYFIGKPNPLMMRTALRMLDVHSKDTAIIGDRMDTDIIAGIETGMDTVLVLSGVTKKEDIDRFPYAPKIILDGVGDIPKLALLGD